MKKIIKTVILTVFTASVIFTSCSDISVSEEKGNQTPNTSHEEKIAIENINSEIILGEKFENLFTVEEVQARNALNEIDEVVEANYMYFRCRSNDKEKQKWLSEKFDFLSIIPLDREILEGGTYYKDPELSEDDAPWYYLMKPIEDYNEVVEHGLIVEVIDEMYLDEEDIAILSADGLEIPEDTYLTVNLDNKNENARFLGWVKRKIRKFVTTYIASIPKGHVYVYNSLKDDYVPVRGVKVVANQLGLLGITHTSDSGSFCTKVPYTSLGGFVQIILKFENSNVIVNGPFKSQFHEPAYFYQGSYLTKDIASLDIYLEKDSRAEQLATVLNAVANYHDYCAANSITKPKTMRIWVMNSIENACTPLCRYVSRDTLKDNSSIIKTTINIHATPITSLTSVFAPDIVLGLKNIGTDRTEWIYSRLFHELSHASHYFGLGSNAKDTWYREYIDMVKGWIEMKQKGLDPFDDCYNNGGTDLVKLIESWGYFSENYIMQWKYNDNTYLDRLIKRKLDDEGKSKKYFYYDGFYKLIAEKTSEYKKVCSNYTYNELYKALIQANVDNADSFAESLVKNINKPAQLDIVKEILTSTCTK